MKYKNILITGGAGFVGSNLAVYLKNKHSDVNVICFDNLSRRGSELNLARFEKSGIDFIKGDVSQENEMLALPIIDLLIDCAAEPSVLASFEDPEKTLATNYQGTINSLNLIKRDNADIIFLSTSRVYPIKDINEIETVERETRFDWSDDLNGIDEKFTTDGFNTVYGESKLKSEIEILNFLKANDSKGVITRFGVIAGPWQMGKIDQGIIGFWLAQHIFRGNLKYIGYNGSGKQVRDILHIDDVCDLIAYQIENLDNLNAEVFNAGGSRDVSVSLLELTQLVEKVTGITLEIGTEEQARDGDVCVYLTDNTKITAATGWKPQRSLQQILDDTYNWIIEYKDQLKTIL